MGRDVVRGPGNAHDPPLLVIPKAIGRQEIRKLCRRIRRLVRESGGGRVRCDLGDIGVNLGTVDTLCRMQLAALRSGGTLQLENVCGELLDLIDLVGLSDLLPGCRQLAREAKRKAEQGEEAVGLQEERDAGDPPVGDIENL